MSSSISVNKTKLKIDKKGTGGKACDILWTDDAQALWTLSFVQGPRVKKETATRTKDSKFCFGHWTSPRAVSLRKDIANDNFVSFNDEAFESCSVISFAEASALFRDTALMEAYPKDMVITCPFVLTTIFQVLED